MGVNSVTLVGRAGLVWLGLRSWRKRNSGH